MFVQHEGKQHLEVETRKEISEGEWDEFFELILAKIKENTKKGVIGDLVCDFSTTGHVERLLSTAVIMDSFQSYFTYGRSMCLCGITKVHFMGSLQDWESVVAKTKNLGKYAVDVGWTRYIEGLLPVLNKFVDTYKDEVDVEWWNKIMDFTQGRLGSGGQKTPYVSGWILNFFYGFTGLKVDVYDVKPRMLNVPIQVKNYCTQVQKDVCLVGGFGGVHKTGRAYRPQLSMIVYWDGNKKPIADDSSSQPKESETNGG